MWQLIVSPVQIFNPSGWQSSPNSRAPTSIRTKSLTPIHSFGASKSWGNWRHPNITSQKVAEKSSWKVVQKLQNVHVAFLGVENINNKKERFISPARTSINFSRAVEGPSSGASRLLISILSRPLHMFRTWDFSSNNLRDDWLGMVPIRDVDVIQWRFGQDSKRLKKMAVRLFQNPPVYVCSQLYSYWMKATWPMASYNVRPFSPNWETPTACAAPPATLLESNSGSPCWRVGKTPPEPTNQRYANCQLPDVATRFTEKNKALTVKHSRIWAITSANTKNQYKPRIAW